MVFLATVLFSLALFVCRREVAERIVVSALSLWLAYESVLGIMQLLGIAGCPEYAFNEYLRMGMEFGILGLLLSVAVIVLGTMMLCHSDSSFHHKSNCAYTTIIL